MPIPMVLGSSGWTDQPSVGLNFLHIPVGDHRGDLIEQLVGRTPRFSHRFLRALCDNDLALVRCNRIDDALCGVGGRDAVVDRAIAAIPPGSVAIERVAAYIVATEPGQTT